jgi:putative membrane protein
LKQCSVELVSIGYGDEKNEVALLFPMIPLADLDDALGKLLEEYRGQRPRIKAPPAAKRYFLMLPIILLVLLTGAASLFYWPILLSLLITLPLLTYARLLYARHAAIGYSDDRLEITTGGFNYQEYRIRMAAVQSVSTNSTWWTERAGLRNYRIDYHAPTLRAIARVRFLSEDHLSDLRQFFDNE